MSQVFDEAKEPKEHDERLMHKCGGCGNAIDHELCYCGMLLDDHTFSECPGVPMGCVCSYADREDLR